MAQTHPIDSTCQSRIGLALAMVIVTVFGAWLNAKADESLPSSTPDFSSVIRVHLINWPRWSPTREPSNLFVSAIGPSLQLGDVAGHWGPTPCRLSS